MESSTQPPSSITTRIKGASVTIDITREDDDYYYGVLNGKEYKRKKRKATVPKFDRELIKNSEAHDGKIIPERTNPICAKCGMDLLGARHPYLPASGPDTPLITLVLDGVSKKEDEAGMLGSNGPANFIISEIIKIAEKFKLKLSKDQIRVSTLTRCARCTGPKQDFKTKGRWCRHFLVQDIQDHRPRVIIPVGSAVLGLLCHKSSAPDWAGRILTYRGWPDDWITTKYATRSHPVFGPKPEMSVPMVPIMNPGMVWAMQSQSEIVAWRKSLKKAVLLACNGSAAPDYTRPYFELTVDPARVREVMVGLINHPAPRLTFDTETSGLKQYSKKQTIVYMMFRWDDGNVQRSIGFPWDYEGSPLKPYLNELSEYILRAVYANKLCGHNLTFDMLWLHATLPGADLDKLANAMDVDTMHMLYALKQARGSRGLELVAYDWCPEMAGYEEEMVLFIEKYSSLLAPDEGGHYANWSSLEATEPKIKEAFKAYIMGDVEVAHITANRLEEKLQEFDGYQIPLASIKNRGKFRLYTTPPRSWVFHSILCPAARTLYKMMARGMHVNEDEVAQAEDLFPKRLAESIETLVHVDPRITDWVASQRATVPDWEFDLEKSDQLKTVLFNLLGLEVQRLTETGIKIFGDLDHCTSPEDRIKYAATDKYTLTRLISEHPSLKPLQDYKKLFKAYSGYVRPMRNSYLDGFDKKERSKYQHLMPDGCVHGSFLLTGTRGGRLCVDEDTVLNITVNGELKSVAIKDIACFLTQDVSILTHNLRWRRITDLIDNGYQDVYSIILETGEELKCTANHRLYTPKGWKHLYELRNNDAVYSCSRSKWSNVRPWFNKELDCRATDDHSRFLPKWSISENLAAISKTVEVNAGDRIQKVGISQIVSASERKYEWKPSSICYNSERNIGAVCLSGLVDRKNSGALPHELFYCQEKHAVPCSNGGGKISYEGAEFDAITTSRNRNCVSWPRGIFQKLCNRQGCVCKEVESSLHKAYADGRFYQGYCRSTGQLFEKQARQRARRDILQVQQIRDDIGTRTYDAWNSIQTGICVEWRETSGFSNQKETYCGDRRRVSYKDSGQCTRFQNGAAWIYDDKIHDKTGFARYDGCLKLNSSRIVKIIPVGKRKVYDITVDDDHSYVAQGFINHNCSKDPNLQQLPHDGDVKKFYDSRFGKRGCLYNGDLSQIELRLLAAACGDPVMVKAYCDGVDLHTLTTSRIFHTDYEVYTKKHMAELQEQGHGDIASKLDMQRKIGKCVDPDTLINVNGSIKRFGSICDGRQPDTFYDLEKRGLFVDSPSGKVRINKFYCNGVAQTVIVCTKKGIVRCSTIHRFLTKDGRLIMAKDLKKGDVLADAVPLIVEHPKDAVIDYNPFGKKSICDKNPVKIHVSDDLAYLLGLFYGDGCTGSGLVAIATGGKSEFFTWQDQIADAALHCGFEPRIDRTLWDADRDGDKKPVLTPNGDEYVVHGSCGRVVLGSTRVSDFFMQLGAINDNAARSKTLEIPEWMFNSCDHTRLEFLAGLFDTDGSTSRGGAISWSTKSWKFCQDVMVMLRSLGIRNSLELSWNKTYLRWYYRLSLSKTDSYSFFKDKLRLKYKNDRLTAPRFQYRHELPNAVLGVIPSGDDLLVEINVNREDHLYCANMLTMRNTTNFLTGYGGGPAGLQGTLAENGIYISLDESENILEGFFESYPTLTQYLSEYKKFVLKNGVAVSITGRVREFNEVFSDDRRMVNKALRAGCNHLIQSTASDMMLTALNAIEFIMRQENMESMLVSTVHDSLLIDAVRDEMPRIHEICNEILNNIPGVMQVVYGNTFDTSWTTLLPFNGDFDIGNNYLDMIKVPENPDWNEIWKRIDNVAA